MNKRQKKKQAKKAMQKNEVTPQVKDGYGIIIGNNTNGLLHYFEQGALVRIDGLSLGGNIECTCEVANLQQAVDKNDIEMSAKTRNSLK
ncbi:hypothetical protein [Bacillus thuringiensis]|uniref:hypothetical protein n=1 Tax=Bacillus thuringiensis TaxID=1428 RepID=UPI000BF616E7|nr:hypothetical protein [Bacillus thuringiensis]EKS7858188.1 hypothetical protein [Bacillus cereus]PEV64104.1 hypothetical protein CN434_25185 [Bacillus thuringiensis]